MDPGQQSSSSSTPFSEEETQLFYSIRGSMDETFRLANALGKVGLWEEISRRFEAFGHRWSPQELEARFGQYKPKRPRKKRKRAAQADGQELQAQGSSSAPHPPDGREQQAQERLACSRRVEEARKRLLDEIDLNAFFSEENSWKGAVISLKLGRSESELGA